MKQRKPKPAAPTTNAHDPLTWLYLNPSSPGFEAEPGFSYGVLRRQYRGRHNSAAEFCRRKLQPVPPVGDPSAVPWVLTAARAEVLLPSDADDRFADPRQLFTAVDENALDVEPALLTYMTMAFPRVQRLHHAWEAAREFAMDRFARARGLPVVVILHAPFMAGSSNSVHCHLLIAPRALTGLGLGAYEKALCCDAGQMIVHDEWLAHRALAAGLAHE